MTWESRRPFLRPHASCFVRLAEDRGALGRRVHRGEVLRLPGHGAGGHHHEADAGGAAATRSQVSGRCAGEPALFGAPGVFFFKAVVPGGFPKIPRDGGF